MMATTGTSANVPEGQAQACPVCSFGEKARTAVANSATAPCERCGYLVWFTEKTVGEGQTIKPTVRLLSPDSLDKLITALADTARTRLVLDFCEVELLPSACLGKLVRLNKNLEAVRGKLVLRGLSPNLVDVFDITGLNRVLTIET